MNAKRVASHPLFRRLAFERRCLGVTLAGVTAAAYFGYILTIAFRPTLRGVPIAQDSVITWGVVVGLGLLCLGFLLTVLYVLIANTRLENLRRRILEDTQ